MFRKITNYFREYAAFAIEFGFADDSKFFPTQIFFSWRDERGFNPAILWIVNQTAPFDEHIFPNPFGWRLVAGCIGRTPRWATEA